MRSLHWRESDGAEDVDAGSSTSRSDAMLGFTQAIFGVRAKGNNLNYDLTVGPVLVDRRDCLGVMTHKKSVPCARANEVFSTVTNGLAKRKFWTRLYLPDRRSDFAYSSSPLNDEDILWTDASVREHYPGDLELVPWPLFALPKVKGNALERKSARKERKLALKMYQTFFMWLRHNRSEDDALQTAKVMWSLNNLSGMEREDVAWTIDEETALGLSTECDCHCVPVVKRDSALKWMQNLHDLRKADSDRRSYSQLQASTQDDNQCSSTEEDADGDIVWTSRNKSVSSHLKNLAILIRGVEKASILGHEQGSDSGARIRLKR